MLLFALLIVWTTRWTVIDAKSLNDNPLNHRALIDALQIKRGRILADNGTVLAESVPASGADVGPALSHRTRSSPRRSATRSCARVSSPGLEDQYRDQLRGLQTGFGSVFGQLGGSQRVGDDVYTSLDPKAQQVAINDLAGRQGSVDRARTRARASILAMYSNPSYDDNNAASGSTFDFALQGQRPPGSTFKVVTTTAGDRLGQVHAQLDDQRQLAQDDLRACRSTTTSTRASASSR